jgi:RNA polymerase sigma factor (TIGR02999 family)
VRRHREGEVIRCTACRSRDEFEADPVVDGPSDDVTRLLARWRDGDEAALQQLVPIVHEELRRMARRQMAGERTGHTLQPTALVNEAYLRLVNLKQMPWQNRAHFFAMAARLMRRVLVDFARSRGYQKRGGGAKQVSFSEALAVAGGQATDVVALNDALEALADVDERKSRVVELRFFGGLSVEETAEVLNVSRETIRRDWTFAKMWLLRHLRT